ncbi:MAG TPA: inositol monophosphatase family protein [Atribacteraceae bacterium]|nr:inositol monophosphatase family protein [Atribacteraceae bacterium]
MVTDLTRRLETAISVARQCGALLVEKQGRIGRIEEKSSPIDLVTDVDKSVQEIIFSVLHAEFPGDGLWGEESGYRLEDFSSTWVVDPIDGTTNFIHGLPGYTVSIAYYREGKPVVGVIDSPTHRETFWALERGGAFLNGRPIQVTGEKRLHRALLGTGFPHDQNRCGIMMPVYSRILCRSQALRALGSAALGAASVASGRLEGYFQLGISFYDIAAGVCLIQEAGGVVSELTGASWTPESRTVLASNRVLREELLAEFSAFREQAWELNRIDRFGSMAEKPIEKPVSTHH